MGTVKIANLRANAIIGTLPHERISRQRLILDIEFDYDASAAAAGDDLWASVDYSAVEKEVLETVENSNCKLLETLAHTIADKVLEHKKTDAVRIKITKPAASAHGSQISYSEEFFRRADR